MLVEFPELLHLLVALRHALRPRRLLQLLLLLHDRLHLHLVHLYLLRWQSDHVGGTLIAGVTAATRVRIGHVSRARHTCRHLRRESLVATNAGVHMWFAAHLHFGWWSATAYH